jgi:glucosamine--fructose-6-phosphate aminotransferase (isomerizing)
MTVMRDEILEQPTIVARLASDIEPYRAAAAEARAAGARFVLYAARGTSDNAAVYGKYLATIAAGLPAGLAVPSAATIYGAKIDFRDCLVIGISQSGETPDVAEYISQARAAGAFTLAITNDEDSLLARAAERTLATHAGHEEAVAATKTYTSQLAALALFWACWTGDDSVLTALRHDVPAAMTASFAVEAKVKEIAARLSHADRLLLTGRGYNYASALETALKIKETCYLAAMPFSAADLMHGPIAMVEPRYPVLLFAVPGKTAAAMHDLAGELTRRGAEVYAVTSPRGGADRTTGTGKTGAAAADDSAADMTNGEVSAAAVLELPLSTPEPLSPLVAVLPGQLLAYHLSLARGFNPDKPRGLRKVTRY